MSQIEERRSPRAKRIAVETLVEICGNEPGLPPFEAEAVDVSGRGMHVRTAYLPSVGDSLVCRFDSEGHEIVVEGEVAWQREGARGGEFGIQFTALDSRSVEALRALCAGKASEQPADETIVVQSLPAGQKVRLHIEGLATPMKALVRDGSRSRVQVGSNLEFLKVGRALELENLDQGQRRQAQIDSVTIAVDPKTQVPQLVVVLRFEDVEATPEPSVIDAKEPSEPRASAQAEPSTPSPREARREPQAEAYGAESPAAPVAESDDSTGELGERLQGAVQGAGELVKQTGQTLTRFSAGAAASMGGLFRMAQRTMAAKRAAERQVRRTAAPPSGVLSVSGKRVVHEAPPRKPEVVKGKANTGGSSKWLLGLMAVAGVAVVFLSGAWVSRLSAAPPPEVEKEPSAEVRVASAEKTAAETTGSKTGADGAPGAAPGEAEAVESEEKEPANRGVVADVPLFGPTPMATMEPAPLGPSAEDEPTLEELERAAANAVVDEKFDKPKKDAKPKKKR